MINPIDIELIVIFRNRDSTILDKLSAEGPRRKKPPDLHIIDFRLLLPTENVGLLYKHATEARIFYQE